MFKKSFLLLVVLCFSVISVASATDTANSFLTQNEEQEVYQELLEVQEIN